MAHSCGRRPAGTPQRSTVRLISGRRHLRTTRPATKHKKFGSFDNRCRTSRELEVISLTHPQPPERDLLLGWSSDQWRSWKTNWWNGTRWTSNASTSNRWGKVLVRFLAGPMPLGDSTLVSAGISRSLPVFEGSTQNFLMWEKAVLRWKGSTDHPVEKLGNKVVSSLDWTVRSLVTRRSGIDFEGLGCSGWLDPGGRIQASLAEGTVQCGERQRRVIPTVHNEEVGANRGSFDSCSRQHANDHLVYGIEGRGTADEAVRTEPQHALALQHGAR